MCARKRESERGGRGREAEGPLYCINNHVFTGSSSTFGKSSDERRDDGKNAKASADAIRSAGKTMNNRSSRRGTRTVVSRHISSSSSSSPRPPFCAAFLFIGVAGHGRARARARWKRAEREGKRWRRGDGRASARRSARTHDVEKRNIAPGMSSRKQIEWPLKTVRQSSRAVCPEWRGVRSSDPAVGAASIAKGSAPRYEAHTASVTGCSRLWGGRVAVKFYLIFTGCTCNTRPCQLNGASSSPSSRPIRILLYLLSLSRVCHLGVACVALPQGQ